MSPLSLQRRAVRFRVRPYLHHPKPRFTLFQMESPALTIQGHLLGPHVRRCMLQDDQNTTFGTDKCYRVMGPSEGGGIALVVTRTYTYRAPASSVPQLCPSCIQKPVLGFVSLHLVLETLLQEVLHDGASPQQDTGTRPTCLSQVDSCPFLAQLPVPSITSPKFLPPPLLKNS